MNDIIAMRKTTPSFIAEFPLATTPTDERELSIRLDAARNLYNACLGESLRRLDLMHQSKAWQAARALPIQVDGKPNKQRREVFHEVQVDFEFSAFSLQKFGQTCRDACWIGNHLGSHDAQTTILRAFRTVEQYAFGKRGRPRFKRFNELDSIEGKEQVVIRYKAEPEPAIHYAGLVLPLLLDPRDKGSWQKEALNSRVKYTRILRRTVRGRVRWYAQIVIEGFAPTKDHKIGDGVVGLDIGPSTIASFSLGEARLQPFCPTVIQPWKELRQVERAMDRSRRTTNPENFNAKGTIKKGRKKWYRSVRYRKLASTRKERERRLAAERKRAHGQLANEILAQGKTIKTEKLSYRSFQSCFGRSVKVRAPGMLVATLKRKAKAASGEVIEIPTRNTKLSQFDHTTGQYVKKPLSQREHVFGDGSTAPLQRDLYSAFLVFCCIANILDIRRVRKTWPSAEPLLRRAMSSEPQSASRRATCSPQGVALRADRPLKNEIAQREAADAVGVKAESCRERWNNSSESPGFSHGEVQVDACRQRSAETASFPLAVHWTPAQLAVSHLSRHGESYGQWVGEAMGELDYVRLRRYSYFILTFGALPRRYRPRIGSGG
jgi:putative transposase